MDGNVDSLKGCNILSYLPTTSKSVFSWLFCNLDLFLFLGSVKGFSTQSQQCTYDVRSMCKPTLGTALFSTISFLLGAITSVLSGFLGMKIATYTNARTTLEARKSVGKAFIVAFRSSAVMGFLLAANGLLVLYITINLFQMYYGDDWEGLFEAITGYGLCGYSMALFGRVGGGICWIVQHPSYLPTTSKSVFSWLFCNLDLFLFLGSVKGFSTQSQQCTYDVRSMCKPTLATALFSTISFLLGAITSVLSGFLGMKIATYANARTTLEARKSVGKAFIVAFRSSAVMGFLLAANGLLVLYITINLFQMYYGDDWEGLFEAITGYGLCGYSIALFGRVGGGIYTKAADVGADLVGKVERNIPEDDPRNPTVIADNVGDNVGDIAGMGSDLFGSYAESSCGAPVACELCWNYRFPVHDVVDSCRTGAATNVIFGHASGYKSVIIPFFAIAVNIFVSFTFAAMYGVAVAALGMLSTIATGLGINAYGPISDNAGGIAEMAGVSHRILERTDAHDAAGNTTAAIGKGFAIVSAALVSLALFGAFVSHAGIQVVDVLTPKVFIGLLVGAMLPYWFSAMPMKSVGSAALKMVEELRRQFNTIPGLMEGLAKPDYATCVKISTDASIKEMIPPGALVMLTPLIVGTLFGVETLSGVLAGALVSGVQVAISASNTGGAWDNARKYMEAGASEHARTLGPKGSDPHKAAVIDDTIGDPLKDTSGPSLNIHSQFLIKLMAAESLVFAPFFAAHGGVLFKLF
ncbi:pyrophosphate-energized vacuolar membrane proton pump [Artemisia annua]|uniref:H(+)-exporting diphosphatase n=1 Tax=Artemisia annua TaxID=35608 RepID=A0A2U1P8C2_ARTAN|nr:pyrophosphate-energized vacuolar membrane proton pump [Artemisia annua]